jgi:hypothetical protein
VRLKKEFNEKHRSDYLRYMHLDLPYHSRRDELGGVISEQDWTAFVRRLEGVIDKVKAKRRKIIKRRKKKGKKLMPRATLFKPPKRAKLDKNPLWREVFMHSSSDEDDSEGDDANDGQIYKMYRDTLLAKGIEMDPKGENKKRHLLSSAQSQPNTAKKKDLTLPPIDGHRTAKKAPATSKKPRAPSVVKPNTMPHTRGESRSKKLRTAA